MPMPDLNDPRVRKELAQHYTKIARQAQRQKKRRALWANLAHTPYFAFIDMLLIALTAALLGGGWVWIVDRL